MRKIKFILLSLLTLGHLVTFASPLSDLVKRVIPSYQDQIIFNIQSKSGKEKDFFELKTINNKLNSRPLIISLSVGIQ